MIRLRSAAARDRCQVLSLAYRITVAGRCQTVSPHHRQAKVSEQPSLAKEIAITSTDATADTPRTSPPSDTAGTTSRHRGFGIDIGGSSIKGGIVDLDIGQLIGDRIKLLTPQPATPLAVAKTIAEVVNAFGWTAPLGVTYPGVVTQGVVRTAANVDDSWIGTNARDIISAELNSQEVTILNDADAAGLAEGRYGAGKNNSGLIVLLTFGTGIGSAVIHNGKLIPNTEFGHLEVDGKEAEQRAASSVKDKYKWSYRTWAKQVTRVLVAIENAMCPDLFIAGGGISRKADRWIPLLENRTPMVAAALQNTAGIVGAAMASTADVTH
ncbi:polyphosphate glucokinase [Mycobacterium leprae Kyoto-2]|uniref:Polyphosphate glucokinase n=3 Tax=Mycobacterium leprae TaxID=1769 RepID=PPGK_MYCLE|nr:RecName: Full=Polyphosphate glucokinase; AltName: Full=ATP-dependent glucokinase; AltName: Full=Polyphosphate--glucose phosphotransferase [Mycobacterium leprae TN]AAA62940.1 u1764fg [Mycobacterium leprae]CAR71118.1 polyphosphate glucokinase [Mycobacterium leprae Br4923]BBC16919.1 polyphosphate glucokinase [Mycobacterium leprae Kyoto-2]AWV49006.1 ROK family protein [Mycobacterium leprae]CAC31404.1 polyphosphate glucokinase [Mycobacterium leprae]